MPILAIGTQDGIVELLNVSKRSDWEPGRRFEMRPIMESNLQQNPRELHFTFMIMPSLTLNGVKTIGIWCVCPLSLQLL